MKRSIWKVLLPCAVTAVVAVTFFLVLFLPKPDPQLTVSTSDVSIQMNEERQLTYNVSIKNAVIKIKIDDNSIVSCTNFTIKALKVGKTKITITATYKNQVSSCVCNVSVSPADQTEPPKTEEPGDPTNPSDPSEPTDPSDPEAPTEPSEPDSIEFEVIDQAGCTIDGKKISLNSNQNCYFRISFQENITSYQLAASNGINLEHLSIGNNTYKIKAQNSGTISIVIDEKVVGTIEVYTLD